jgi:hypothetical protein
MVALMGAEADAVCGAGYRERSDERANIRNGYRRRDWDTRTGSISLADRLCWMAQALAWACSPPPRAQAAQGQDRSAHLAG